jgi:hypothetical protein
MQERPSASTTLMACGMVSGYSPPCSMVSKRRPGAIHVRILWTFFRRELGKPMGECCASLQLAAPPVRAFAIGIEDADGVTMERLQGRDAREHDRATLLGGSVKSLAAVTTVGISWSDFGIVSPRCAIASRSVANLTPSSSTIGSAKRRDQDTTQLRDISGIQVGGGETVPAQKSPGRCRGF